MKRKAIAVYAGSVRWGGGLTVVEQILAALSTTKNCNVVVYTGDASASRSLSNFFAEFDHVREVGFFRNAPSFLRYVCSKVLFLVHRFYTVISVNYYLPVRGGSLVVFHSNLLNFRGARGDRSLGACIRRLDAKCACKRAKENIFESRFLLRTASEMVGEIQSPSCVYLGINDAFYVDEQNARELSDDGASLLLVSSLAPHKDNVTALNVVRDLQARWPNISWRLVVAGGGSVAAWADFVQLAENIGVKDQIDVIGPVSKSELCSTMSASLCVICPSRIESFCAVAVEAMAAGCPAIVTSETSMPESVGEAAIIVRAGDFKAMATEVHELFSNPEKRSALVHAGRRHADSFRTKGFISDFLGKIGSDFET